jgi:hypothetical protein
MDVSFASAKRVRSLAERGLDLLVRDWCLPV